VTYVRLLLDTHVLLWWLDDDSRLAPDAREAVVSPESFVAVSAASAWELSIKSALGRLELPDQLQDQLEREEFSPLPITVPHALRAGSLPRHHADPVDRMLVAQAQLEGLTVVTRDPRIAAYDVPILAA
jgi:PIN domain nuclease of toxin-antitoxin system